MTIRSEGASGRGPAARSIGAHPSPCLLVRKAGSGPPERASALRLSKWRSKGSISLRIALGAGAPEDRGLGHLGDQGAEGGVFPGGRLGGYETGAEGSSSPRASSSTRGRAGSPPSRDGIRSSSIESRSRRNSSSTTGRLGVVPEDPERRDRPVEVDDPGRRLQEADLPGGVVEVLGVEHVVEFDDGRAGVSRHRPLKSTGLCPRAHFRRDHQLPGRGDRVADLGEEGVPSGGDAQGVQAPVDALAILALDRVGVDEEGVGVVEEDVVAPRARRSPGRSSPSGRCWPPWPRPCPSCG